MTPTDLKLYELLGDKNLSFGCVVKFEGNEGMVTISSNTIGITAFIGHGGNTVYANRKVIDIIGHEPTIADLHRMFASLKLRWLQSEYHIELLHAVERMPKIPYDSSLSLLSQSEETKLAIVNLIESYERQSLPISR